MTQGQASTRSNGRSNGEWSAADIPALEGRFALVTGANSGLGFHTALELSRKGADVVVACRNAEKGREAIDAMRSEHANGSLELMPLDLASLASIADFAKRFRESRTRLDILCNNAGVMALPRRETPDGFEMQLGTNHLGHFALTGQLLDLLLTTPGSRVVNVSSTMHKLGRMNFDDLQSERRYNRWIAYGQSKLANLLFTYELQRRFERAGRDALAAASHPGYAATNLQTAGPRMDGSSFMESAAEALNAVASQSSAMGALPSLYAATAPDVEGGDYLGPGGFMEMRGHPKKVSSSARSRDEQSAARLWEVSERLTGVRYAALA